jgi:hypothetical protein
MQKRITRPTRISNRIYPAKQCLKPSCGRHFLPTDARQKYCCEQHRIDHNNDQRKLKNVDLKIFGDKIAHNQAVLQKIYNKMPEFGHRPVNVSLLKYEDFYFDIYSSREKNPHTGLPVCWSWDYGIEGSDPEMETYIIHKKKIST